MGFFGKSDQEARRRFGATIVAEGSELAGELTLQGKLHVDGVIRGSIRSDGDVTVGRSGLVDGDVVAEHMIVSGKVKGNVRCEYLEVVASGTVVGDVISRDFVVEKGAHFEGENHLPTDDRGDAVPRLKPVEPSDPVSRRIGAADSAGDSTPPTPPSGEPAKFRR